MKNQEAGERETSEKFLLSDLIERYKFIDLSPNFTNSARNFNLESIQIDCSYIKYKKDNFSAIRKLDIFTIKYLEVQRWEILEIYRHEEP